MPERSEPMGMPGLHRFRRYPEYRDSGVEWLGEIPAHEGGDLLIGAGDGGQVVGIEHDPASTATTASSCT